MAQSQNNLTVGIEVRTAQAKAQIDAFKAQLTVLRRELLAATKVGDTAQIEKIKGSIAGVNLAMTGLNRTVNQSTVALTRNTAATVESTSAHVAATPVFRQYARGFAIVAREAGVAVGGVNALRAGLVAFAAAQVAGGLKSVSDRIADIGKAGRETRFGPQNIQILTKAFEELGTKAEDAQPIITGLGRALEEEQKKLIAAGQSLGGTTILGPGSAFNQVGQSAATVFRGATKEAVDFGNVLKELRVDIQRLPEGEQGVTEFFRQLVRGFDDFIKRGDRPRAEFLARSLPGAPTLEPMLSALRRAVSERDRIRGDLERTGQLVTPDVEEKARQAQIAVNDLTGAFRGLQQQIALTVFPDVTSFVASLTKAIEDPTFIKQVQQDVESLRTIIGDIIPLIDQVRQALSTPVEGPNMLGNTAREIEQIKQLLIDFAAWWDRYSSGIADAAQRLWSSIKPSGQTPAPTQQEIGGGMGQDFSGDVGGATGGFVRGPGTSTSDSIPARLSTGEYVLTAASVRRLGVGFLHSLNRFAEGGLVAAPPLHFAEGGIAEGGGRAMATFHFESGKSFALGASVDVLGAMVKEAHSQQIRSAGVKPSWFAGRPSGR